MNKQMNADDLMVIMSEQLRAVTAKDRSEDTLRVSDSVANMVGKVLKLSALRIAYREHLEQDGDIIEALEVSKAKGGK